jgi:mono/diheme cytochrome c family protein
MNKLSKTAGILAAFSFCNLLAFAAPASAQAKANLNSAEVKRGQALWDKNGCYLCHGTVGQGGVGPAVAVDLVPLVAVNAYVRHPTGDMPPYSEKVLSDADLKDIYAYLSSQADPKKADSIPLLPKPVMVGGSGNNVSGSGSSTNNNNGAK